MFNLIKFNFDEWLDLKATLAGGKLPQGLQLSILFVKENIILVKRFDVQKTSGLGLQGTIFVCFCFEKRKEAEDWKHCEYI